MGGQRLRIRRHEGCASIMDTEIHLDQSATLTSWLASEQSRIGSCRGHERATRRGISSYQASLPTEDSRDDIVMFRATRSVWTNTVCRCEPHPSSIPAPRTAIQRGRGNVTGRLSGEGLRTSEERGSSEKKVRCTSMEPVSHDTTALSTPIARTDHLNLDVYSSTW